MGFFRFRRSFRIAPGLRFNIGKRSTSVSVGVRGAHVTFGKAGTRTTVGVPGTGLSYTEVTPHRHATNNAAPPATALRDEPTPIGSPVRGWIWIAVMVCLAIAIIVGLTQ